MKLISMTDFILEMDWLTTNEFCDKYGIPKPKFTGNVESSANEILTIDAIKHRFFVSYAKVLNKNITINMFYGTNPFFIGFKEVDSRGGYRTFVNDRLEIINDNYGFWLNPYDSCDGKRLSKIETLINLGLEIDFNLS